MIGRAKTRSTMRYAGPAYKDSRILYSATCINAITSGDNTSETLEDYNGSVIDIDQITVLNRVPIRSLEVKLFMDKVTDLLNFKRNSGNMLKILQDLLATYGIVNSCEIKFDKDPVAEFIGLKKVEINNVRTCCGGENDDNCVIDHTLDIVGSKFICANKDCTSKDSSNVTKNRDSSNSSYVPTKVDPLSSSTIKSVGKSPKLISNGIITVTGVECYQIITKLQDAECCVSVGGLEEAKTKLQKAILHSNYSTG